MATRVFLSGVASRTHLVYAASYLRHLLATRPGPVTVVNVGLRPFLGEHQVAESDLLSLLPRDPRLAVVPATFAAPHGEQRVYLAVGAPGIKPLLRLRAAAPFRRLHVAVVDEGLGSYGTWRTRRDAWLREGRAPWWSWVRAVAVASARRLLTDERWATYLRTTDGWSVHEPVAAEFRRAGQGPPRGPRPPYAVVLSQPYAQLGMLEQAEVTALFREISAQCKDVGLALVVRPHPAERSPEVPGGVELAATTVPAELDATVLGAQVVLGTATTALLNLAAFGLARTIRLDLPGVRDSELALGAEQAGLLAAFLPQPVPVTHIAAAVRAS